MERTYRKFGNLCISADIFPQDTSGNYSKLVDMADISSAVEQRRVMNKIFEFGTKKEMDGALSSSLSSFKDGDVLKVNSFVSYAITGIRPDKTYTLTHIANDMLVSRNEDMTLSANPAIGRMETTIEVGKWWYAADTGIRFVTLTGAGEPDGIRRVIYSNSEKCYYLATTQGLYRTYNDDLSECERILSADLVCNKSASNLSSPDYRAHIPCIREIGDRQYLMFITGATGYSKSHIATLDSKNMVAYVNPIDSGEGWMLDDTVISSDDRYVRVAATNANDGSFLIRNVTIDRQSLSSLNMTNTSKDVTTGGSHAGQYIQRLNNLVFVSRHYSDASSGRKSTGLVYFDEQYLGNESISCYTVPALDDSRIYSIKAFNNIGNGVLFACCGLSSQDPNDRLGLYRVTQSGADVECASLSADPAFVGLRNCKDVYYSEKTSKWMFVLDQQIYISDASEDGGWTQLTATGRGVGLETYPKFNEIERFIMTNELHKSEDASGGRKSNMILTFTDGLQRLATLGDIKVKKVTVDGEIVQEDEHGFINIDMAASAYDFGDTATASVDATRQYTAGEAYAVGDYIRHDSDNYKCVTAVASATTWETDSPSFVAMTKQRITLGDRHLNVMPETMTGDTTILFPAANGKKARDFLLYAKIGAVACRMIFPAADSDGSAITYYGDSETFSETVPYSQYEFAITEIARHRFLVFRKALTSIS